MRWILCLIGDVLGRVARTPVLLIFEAWGGLQKHIPLIQTILENPRFIEVGPGPVRSSFLTGDFGVFSAQLPFSG